MANTPTQYPGPIPVPIRSTANLPTYGKIGPQGDKPHDASQITVGTDNAISTKS